MHRTLFEVVAPICGLAIFGGFFAPFRVMAKGIAFIYTCTKSEEKWNKGGGWRAEG
jgi:hypothetical protein